MMFDKECHGQALGQDVRLLILSVDLVNGDVTLLDVLVEMMELYVEMLGAWSDLVYGHNLEHAAVFFKDLAMHSRLGGLDVKSLISNFAK